MSILSTGWHLLAGCNLLASMHIASAGLWQLANWHPWALLQAAARLFLHPLPSHRTPSCCPLPPPAASISLELVSAASGLESHEIAKCLSSAVVSIAADCKVSIAAPTADNSYVDAMWTTTGMASYSDYKLCPASSTPVYDTDVPTSLKLAFNGYTHGFDTSGATPTALKGVGVTDVAFASFGKVTITIDSTATLVYAIRATVNSTTSFDNTAAVAVTKDNAATGFTANTEFLTNANIGMNCGSGRYGLLMGDFKLCPLCPAGSVGTGGFSCKPCAAGTASGAVGFSGTCASCAAGTYAQDGECQPCQCLLAEQRMLAALRLHGPLACC